MSAPALPGPTERSMPTLRNLLLIAAVLVTGTAVFPTVNAAPQGNRTQAAQTITIEEARKIALKRVPGEIEDEYSIEDDEGKTTDYIFYIKDKKGKTWEVQIDAAKGTVVSAEEQTEEDAEDPPADEDPPYVLSGS